MKSADGSQLSLYRPTCLANFFSALRLRRANHKNLQLTGGQAPGDSPLVVTHIFGGLAVTFESQGVRELVQHLPTHRRNRLMPNRLRRCV